MTEYKTNLKIERNIEKKRLDKKCALISEQQEEIDRRLGLFDAKTRESKPEEYRDLLGAEEIISGLMMQALRERYFDTVWFRNQFNVDESRLEIDNYLYAAADLGDPSMTPKEFHDCRERAKSLQLFARERGKTSERIAVAA